MKFTHPFSLGLLLFSLVRLSAQTCGIGLSLNTDIPAVAWCHNSMTMHEDALGRNFLYVANKEEGLTIYDISGSPTLVQQVTVDLFDSLHVMNLSQHGSYLYLAIGNHFGTDSTRQMAGLAIVDVSNPASAFVTDHWVDSTTSNGCGIAISDGNVAFLGVMDRGVVTLDVSNKADISFLARIIPDVNFPDPTPDLTKINARGMALRDDVLYVCYDAGGFRVINVANPALPVETGRYSLPALDALPRAYNNVVVHDTLAYVAIDWCGMEILNISDTSNITQVGWWNPWDCTHPDSSWFTSPGYANEIALDTLCKRVFLSTGRNDLMVVNAMDPSAPDSCDSWGSRTDVLGTWGVSVTPSRVYLGYICSPLIPFFSLPTFVRVLDIGETCLAAEAAQPLAERLTLWPNPTGGLVRIELPAWARNGQASLQVSDAMGRNLLSRTVEENLREVELLLPEQQGIFVVRLAGGGRQSNARVVRE